LIEQFLTLNRPVQDHTDLDMTVRFSIFQRGVTPNFSVPGALFAPIQGEVIVGLPFMPAHLNKAAMQKLLKAMIRNDWIGILWKSSAPQQLYSIDIVILTSYWMLEYGIG
jgi:hypothetical protein